MSDMGKGTVSVRELQQNLKDVLGRVERGETIDVTRHRRLVARLSPAMSARDARPWPDLEARTRQIFGDRLVSTAGSSTVIEGRGER
jgi:prevent-host-death family protein